MLRIALFFPFFLLTLVLNAQQSLLLDNNLRTLRTEIDGTHYVLPVISIEGRETIHISFDEMSHEYHRFTYRVQHADRNWQPTEGLFESEYLDTNRSNPTIDNFEESRNTTTLYTHYSFDFPNVEMRPLLSGNYRLYICDDDSSDPDSPVAVVCFCVAESRASIAASVTTNTEVDWNGEHQQLEMNVSWRGLDVRDAREDIHTVVMQNNRLDNRVIDARPSYVNGDRLIWEHQRQLVFKAGNEYRKFETTSTRQAGMHTEALRWIEPYYNIILMPDEPRRNYLFQEDFNGISVIRNIDQGHSETESEYVLTHFILHAAPLADEDEIYVTGQWAQPAFAPEYRMTYDEEIGCYTASLYLKQGYYEYQYLVRENNAPTLNSTPIEGNYYQTTNEYDIYVYYTSPSERYDRLVGYTKIHK